MYSCPVVNNRSLVSPVLFKTLKAVLYLVPSSAIASTSILLSINSLKSVPWNSGFLAFASSIRFSKYLLYSLIVEDFLAFATDVDWEVVAVGIVILSVLEGVALSSS